MAKKDNLYLIDDDRITSELSISNGDKDGFCVRIFIDEQLFNNIFCERISVFNVDRPTYCLYVGSVNIFGFAPKMMKIFPDATAKLNMDTMKLLPKKYLEIVRS